MIMRSRRILMTTVVVLAILLAVVGTACGSDADNDSGSGAQPSPASSDPAAGGAAPAQISRDLAVLAPADFGLAAFSGAPLVVNFFGSWCGPCNTEAPDFADFVSANPDVHVVGIAVSDREADVRDFMGEYGLAYPVVMDDNSLSSAWGVRGVPTTVFINSSGQEVDRLVGAASRTQFDESLTKAR
jgi:thiol-disulfide isomerase/thioredoxin